MVDAGSSAVAQAPALSQAEVGALLGAILALGGAVLVPLVMLLGRLWIPRGPHFFARWGFTHLAQVVLLWLAASFVAALAFGRVESFEATLWRGALVFLPPAAWIVILAKRLDPDGLHALGWRLEGSTRASLFGLAAYALLLPALFGVTLFWPWLFELLGGEHETQDVVREFLQLESGARLVPVIFGVLVLPFFEELAFRAFLQPLLVQNLREVGGVVLTAALFGLLHGLSAFLPVFVLALILGGVMQRTRRFAACWAVHAAHNGLILALLLYSPGAQDWLGTGTLLAVLLP